MSKWANKADLHRAKVKIGLVQGAITKRRIELWEKLEPLIENEKDKRIIEIALRGKNCTPRYW